MLQDSVVRGLSQVSSIITYTFLRTVSMFLWEVIFSSFKHTGILYPDLGVSDADRSVFRLFFLPNIIYFLYTFWYQYNFRDNSGSVFQVGNRAQRTTLPMKNLTYSDMLNAIFPKSWPCTFLSSGEIINVALKLYNPVFWKWSSLATYPHYWCKMVIVGSHCWHVQQSESSVIYLQQGRQLFISPFVFV